MTAERVIVDHAPLTAAVAAIFEHYDLSAADAGLAADGLVLADLRGVWSHGVARVSMYAERLRRGLIDPKPAIAIERPAPALAHMDGGNGIGFVVATRAIDAAMEIAEGTGGRRGRRAPERPLWHGGDLRPACDRRRLRELRLHQRLAGDAALGRARPDARHEPVRGRHPRRAAWRHRDRHGLHGDRARQAEVRRPARRGDSRGLCPR